MERFTKDQFKYWSQIKKKLLDFDDNESARFMYLEMGQLFTHGFSVRQLDTEIGKLQLKKWNPEFGNNRFDKELFNHGFFNLDRLAITEMKINLDVAECEELNELLSGKLQLTNWGGIVLDGLFCQFETGNLKLEWNCDNDINRNLARLITLVREKVYNTPWKEVSVM